ncbi:sigma-54-dependent Fis family transcriptional regulator [Novipirellula artificiosorum]|uniref:Nitrogen fixation protein VnfA n=1 Tax=Novipirellula artificiosorum TaxID=2528016 RepID=A0A5C6E086_9BACT|nr:sigma 54-interacting transcriptional regulator [Novipirellula artificiosorum]TWU42270.1 Nitrogen fixation protein VnfA [Novipirellula artificiosorum]
MEVLTNCAEGCPVHADLASATSCAELRGRREVERSTLLQIARLLSDRPGQQQTLLEIVDTIEQKLAVLNVTVMMLTIDGQRLELEATRSPVSVAPGKVAYGRGEGVIGRVLKQGRAEIVPDIGKEPHFRNRIHERTPRQLEATSFVCVPIIVEGETVGTLSADLKTKDVEALKDNAETLGIIASMIAYDVNGRRTRRLEREMLELQNLQLRDALEERFRPSNMIGGSKPMRQLYTKIQQVASSDTTVLIRGESGTGKELVATAIHCTSVRAKKPLVKVNCAALNENLLESELFGHEKGAFTGAVEQRHGRIEEAEGGTLFLDEVGEFSPVIQVKLLRVLQERQYERVGSSVTRTANVRIVAATNRDLEEAVREGRFRQDLYYRINVFPVHLPPLRKRRGDIMALADHFVEKFSKRMDRSIKRISTPAINTLMMYHWPGNVRELENCLEHAVLLAQDGVIHSHNFPPSIRMPDETGASESFSLSTRVAALERDMISDSLKRSGGNMAAAARELGISSRIIRYKVRNLGIDWASEA